MSYVPLCQVQLQHNYFSDGFAQHTSLIPAAQTGRQLHNAQLLFKATKQGGMLLLDSSRRDIAAACVSPSLTLHFLLYSKDSLFGSYSEPTLQQGQLLYCDNSAPVQQTEAIFRLHAAAELSTTEIVSSDDDRLSMLAEVKQLPLPLLVLALTITSADLAQSDATSGRHYLIKFGSRRIIWRYYLSGDSFSQSVHIRDLTQQSQFVQQADVTLNNGRSAKVFDSTEPLVLAQQSPYRFALISQAGSNEKILIKRLPVATAGRWGNAVVNEVKSSVAEIYLNY